MSNLFPKSNLKSKYGSDKFKSMLYSGKLIIGFLIVVLIVFELTVWQFHYDYNLAPLPELRLVDSASRENDKDLLHELKGKE